MVSYASDNAYNLYKYKKSKFDVLVPSVGGFKQLEGSSLISKEKIKPEAKEFINFLLSDEVQSKIFQNNWMMPVTNVKLPDIAKYYVKADKYLNIPNSEIEKNLPGWLRDWAGIVTKK
jgi:thiamine transport system substrate-binding protein